MKITVFSELRTGAARTRKTYKIVIGLERVGSVYLTLVLYHMANRWIRIDNFNPGICGFDNEVNRQNVIHMFSPRVVSTKASENNYTRSILIKLEAVHCFYLHSLIQLLFNNTTSGSGNNATTNQPLFLSTRSLSMHQRYDTKQRTSFPFYKKSIYAPTLLSLILQNSHAMTQNNRVYQDMMSSYHGMIFFLVRVIIIIMIIVDKYYLDDIYRL